jgi:hypothetical protein
MRRALHSSLCLAALAVVAPAFAVPAHAHSYSGTMAGVRAGSYRDTDRPFAGVELLSYVGNHFYFNPNGEYVFLDRGQKGTVNFDLHVDIPTSSPVYVWVGGGLGLLYTDTPGAGGSDVAPKGNLLAGVGLSSGRLIPYFQVKLIAGDQKEAVVALGLRF